LKFNNNNENPLIGPKGWKEFKNFHGLPDNVEIDFIFHGNNYFEVRSFKEITSGNVIPPFHSRSVDAAKTVFFDFELSNLHVNVPELVSFTINEYLKKKLTHFYLFSI
jgi:hypothetical protein